MTFDLRPLARTLEQAQANLDCLCCGASNVNYSDTRYALVEIEASDHLALQPDWGLGSGMFCGARICETCGFVHLHSLLTVERRQQESL